jgi:RNA exonuclease 1
VDFFTAETLVDQLVLPRTPMLHYNTAFSGVRPGDVMRARREGKALMGREGAREALWRFVGPNTVLVGHALQNDLNALRLLHGGPIVDSYVLEAERRSLESVSGVGASGGGLSEGSRGAAGGDGNGDGRSAPAPAEAKKGGMSLKVLAAERLGWRIQRKTHDSLEDAVAARGLVIWHLERMELEDRKMREVLVGIRKEEDEDGGAPLGNAT